LKIPHQNFCSKKCAQQQENEKENSLAESKEQTSSIWATSKCFPRPVTVYIYPSGFLEEHMPSAPLGATGLKMTHHEITFMPAVQILYSYEHVAFCHTGKNSSPNIITLKVNWKYKMK